jgi:hypothetical protein
VGGQHQRHALLLEPEQPLPHQVARLRVEARGRLVEQHHLGLVDQGPGDRQPPFHAARQRLDPAVGPLGQLHEVEQLVGPLPGHLAGDAEEAGVRREVLPDRQLDVEVVELRADTELGADAGAVVPRVHPQDLQLAAGRWGHTPDHAHGRALAGTVGPEEPERLAPPHVDVDPVDRREVAEPLHQPTRMNK